MRFQDLSGMEFNHLRVISRADSKGNKTRWNCVCKCGASAVVHATSLVSGRTKSCGCVRATRNTCSVEGCRNAAHGQGLCIKHYTRMCRTGSTEIFIQSSEERYRSSYVAGEVSDCWNWSKGLTSDGYGKFKINKRTVIASRYGWELSFGDIPPGMLVCHTCDNPKCQNPSHWFLGTNGDNMADKVRKGRVVANPYRNRKNGRFTSCSE